MASATGDCKTSIAADSFAPPLPAPSLDFHVFKQGEVQRPLLLVGEVCNSGCGVLFTQGHCHFFKDQGLLLWGARNPRTGLHSLPRRPCTPKITFGYNLSQPYCSRAHDACTIPKLMSYPHGCAGCPTTSSWIEAICAVLATSWVGQDSLPEGCTGASHQGKR